MRLDAQADRDRFLVSPVPVPLVPRPRPDPDPAAVSTSDGRTRSVPLSQAQCPPVDALRRDLTGRPDLRRRPAGDSPRGARSDLVEQARDAARGLLRGLHDEGRRWRHTQGVAARAHEAAAVLPSTDRDVLEAAAWLHDIGYAPSLIRSGFHPVDGAVFAQTRLHRPDVAALIANHSGARYVASVRGMSGLMTPYDQPQSWSGPVADALTWADQTTGPDGETVTVEQRMQETSARHGPGSPNERARAQRSPAIIAAVRATERLLAAPATEAVRARKQKTRQR